MAGAYIVGFVLILFIIFVIYDFTEWCTEDIPDDEKLKSFLDNLWKRTTGNSFPGENASTFNSKTAEEAERVLTYAHRVLDRQINKTIGILPFNSVVIATLAIESNRLTSGMALDRPIHNLLVVCMYLVIVGLLISSWLCLTLLSVNWGKVESYQKYATEFEATAKLFRDRSRTVEQAIVISVACLIVGSVAFGLLELADSFQKPSSPIVSQPQPTPDIGFQLDLAAHGIPLDCGEGVQQIVTFKTEGQTNFDNDKYEGSRQLDRVLAALKDSARTQGRRLFGLVLVGSADKEVVKPTLKSTYADNHDISKKRVEWVRANLSAKLAALNPLGFNPPEIISVNPQLPTVRLVSPTNDVQLVKAVAVCALWW